MIDPKFYRTELKALAENLLKRGFHLEVERFQAWETARKTLQTKTENLQSQRNQLAKAVGQKKTQGENAEALLQQSESLAQALKACETALAKLLEDMQQAQLAVPNPLDETVPAGRDEKDNVELRRVGEPRNFLFTPKDHVDLAVTAGWMDFDRAAMIASSRFVVMQGGLARVHRALIQFMLDVHTKEHGYQEVYVPYLANAQSLYGTGQLPKFEADQFKTTFDPTLYLIPTAEVPLTNLARDRI